ncbi:hypothetical protein SDC9_83451 [bioreactor metagenome]|uniref:Uncharacterized protein n=1 Tax=bioreactor metagenome TaxID=1076179 RepID=A0A644Z877_9ZZZZ
MEHGLKEFFSPGGTRPDLLDRHAVKGKCPGLIRADHLSGAQGLHGGQPSDDGSPACHALHPHGEHNRDHRHHPLRDGGHRQGNGGEKHIEGIPPAQLAHRENDRGNGDDQVGE